MARDRPLAAVKELRRSLAARLLADHLPSSARYVGVDLSSTMVSLARDRLAPFGDRCEVRLADGEFHISSHGGPFDRFVSTYVLDLLSITDIQHCLIEAHTAMLQGGLFCHAGLTKGTTPISRIASALRNVIHRIKPTLVGGCRPLTLCDLLPDKQWRVVARKTVVSSGIPSEVVIAERVITNHTRDIRVRTGRHAGIGTPAETTKRVRAGCSGPNFSSPIDQVSSIDNVADRSEEDGNRARVDFSD